MRISDWSSDVCSSDLGKVVIVTFWASWCGPCRRELPVLGKVQSIVGRDHLEVIAVNFKEDRRDFNAVIRANKDIDLRYIRDPKGRISDSYGVNSLPNMFIVDVDGKVAHVHRGYSRSEEHTSELQSLMRISYAVFCLKKKTQKYTKIIR